MTSNTGANRKPGTFVKGDPRINRKGRPKSFDALRELAQQIAHEVAKSGGGDVVINGRKVTVSEAILRQWAGSKNPQLQKAFMEIAFGKVVVISVAAAEEVAVAVDGRDMVWVGAVGDEAMTAGPTVRNGECTQPKRRNAAPAAERAVCGPRVGRRHRAGCPSDIVAGSRAPSGRPMRHSSARPKPSSSRAFVRDGRAARAEPRRDAPRDAPGREKPQSGHSEQRMDGRDQQHEGRDPRRDDARHVAEA